MNKTIGNRVSIRLNDVFDDLNEENHRLSSELLFANKCIEILHKFKYYLDRICDKFGDTLDTKLSQELHKLDEQYKRVLLRTDTGHRVDIQSDQKCLQLIPKEEPIEVKPLLSASESVVRKYRNLKTGLNHKNHNKYVFRCDWIGCYFVTNRNSRLRAHHNYHTGSRPFRCALCEKAFVGRESLTTHIKAVHNSDRLLKCNVFKCVRRVTRKVKPNLKVLSDEKPYVCDVVPDCPYRSRTRQALREHKLTHGERTLKCSQIGCEKVFKNKKQLKNHELTHSVEPPHKCTFEGCSAAFRTYKTLKIHRLRHTNETPKFSCDWPGCEFSSVYNWILQRHRMIHTGEKPYKCSWPQCESRFRRNHYLKAHMLKHSGEKPFACDWPGCDRRFQSKQALKIHLEKTHNFNQVCFVNKSEDLTNNCL